MADILKPDLCIIGAGSSGLAAAEAARALGARVVVIERARMGGDGLNAGGVPTRALAAAGRTAHTMRTAARFGLAEREPHVDIAAVNARVRSVVAGIAPEVARERLAALGVEVIAAEARFLDRRTVGAGEKLVRARRFIIATGSRPTIPAIPGLADVPFLTTETIFHLTERPRRLAIVGGTSAGLEIAQAYRRLGAPVVVIDAGRALAEIDPELTSVALTALRTQGVDIREQTRITEIVGGEGGAIGVRVAGAEGQPQTLEASHLLIASDRHANIDGLDLAKAGIRIDPRDASRLRLSAGLRTSNRRFYAIGDATGGSQSTHAARYQAQSLVRRVLLGPPARYQPSLVPRVVWTDPELAEVGLTEPQVRARRGTAYRVTRLSLAEVDRASAQGEGRGVARMITDPSGRILGVGIAGPQAGELISLFALALANRLSARDLAGFVAPYPALGEIAQRLGQEHLRSADTDPWQARRLALNRLLP
ncbi:dihydrolipoyl dehydrogenase family protein [Devosia nitrariae]|uniref:Mercuric reductase n=1 Tax=Devosia nitrariae TaxID=2071872 RepID=A0ABQ5W3S3_9HYPH|nr:NAD(P)/FAD-dependent oxidoreductase [Devosia nitrariae]GLQ54722.1 mercuric reductase [Devosia nitrariae]